MLGVAVATTAALAGCPLFGPSFPTNQRVDRLPVASNSGAIVRSIGLDDNVHADFGSGMWEGSPIGIPYTVVHGTSTPNTRAMTWLSISSFFGVAVPCRLTYPTSSGATPACSSAARIATSAPRPEGSGAEMW